MKSTHNNFQDNKLKKFESKSWRNYQNAKLFILTSLDLRTLINASKVCFYLDVLQNGPHRNPHFLLHWNQWGRKYAYKNRLLKSVIKLFANFWSLLQGWVTHLFNYFYCLFIIEYNTFFLFFIDLQTWPKEKESLQL